MSARWLSREIMDASKFIITKLNSTNYLVWATQMEALLQARDLWKFVGEEDTSNEEVSVNAPTAVGASTTETDVMKSKSMARAAITCSIEAEHVPTIAAIRDPREMWNKLADANKSMCTASVHTLRNRLLYLKVGQTTSIREFVNQICAIERQLAFAGKIVEEDDKKYALLNGLRPEFAIQKTILQETYGATFEKMVSSLELTEDEVGSGRSPGSGAFSSASSFYTGKDDRRNNLVCFICNKPGHKMRDCFFNP